MFFVIVFILLLFSRLWFFRDPSVVGLTLMFANKGVGKTTFMSMMANKSKYQKKYKHIYSNMPIENTYQYNVKRDLGIKNIVDSLVMIDEATTMLGNRITLPEHQIEYLRLQRHYKSSHETENTILAISQSWDDLNINLRRIYDRVYLMEHAYILSFLLHRHVTKIRRIKKYIDIDEVSQKPTDCYSFYFFLWGTTYFIRNPWYKYFDSLYRVDLAPTVEEDWNLNIRPHKNKVQKLKDWVSKKKAS